MNWVQLVAQLIEALLANLPPAKAQAFKAALSKKMKASGGPITEAELQSELSAIGTALGTLATDQGTLATATTAAAAGNAALAAAQNTVQGDVANVATLLAQFQADLTTFENQP